MLAEAARRQAEAARWRALGAHPKLPQAAIAQRVADILKSYLTTRTPDIDGKTPILRQDYSSWYQEMFSPAVVAGILQARQLAGYRNNPVYLRGSRYVPPAADAIADCMDEFFSFLKSEPEPIVRATLGHFIFVYIHPYSDGNGRIGRFLMNTAIASGGYPWTVIRQKRRDEYLAALEEASAHHNIRPFARFLLEEMEQLDTTEHG